MSISRSLIGVLSALTLIAGCASKPVAYLVTAPTPCHQVEKVEGNRIYLRSSGKICAQVLGSVPVTLDRSYGDVEIYSDGRLWKREAPRFR